MLHVITISPGAADSPFGRALRDAGIAYRLFTGTVPMSYRSRFQLIFQRLPRRAVFALLSAIRSLILSRPAPTTVIVESDIEVLMFALIRRLTCRPTRIVLVGFIYTSRTAGWQNAVRRHLFRFILWLTDIVIVHSRLEAQSYPAAFGLRSSRFRFVPWGTNIHIRDALLHDPAPTRDPSEPPYIISAGRSGRDYPTLLHAVDGMTTEVRIVCDFGPAIGTGPLPANVKVLQDCYGNDYIEQLFRAEIVVVPLAASDISAGQMVVLQAMALGKAVIVTATPTITDYVEDGRDALLVQRGDAADLAAAIHGLMDDPALRATLGRNAQVRYEAFNTTETYVRNIISAATSAPV